MKITITREKYLKHECPELSEEMLDWLFLTMWSTRAYHVYKTITRIDIKANQAYKGSPTIHFYIVFNNDHENSYHKTWDVNMRMSEQNPSISTSKKYQKRWRWVLDFHKRNGCDMGKFGEKYYTLNNRIRHAEKLNKKFQEEIDREAWSYDNYLNLKRKFEPDFKYSSLHIINQKVIESIIRKIDVNTCDTDAPYWYENHIERVENCVDDIIKGDYLEKEPRYHGWYIMDFNKFIKFVKIVYRLLGIHEKVPTEVVLEFAVEYFNSINIEYATI